MKLKKHLELVDLIFFGIGAIVGTGIFVIPAIAAKIAGVASFWVWLELGVLTIFMAFCFAELASVYPHAGGPYKFVKESFGNFSGFLVGWLAWVISWITMASLAVAVVFYLEYFYDLPTFMIPILSVLILALITVLNYHGLHWGVKAQYILTTTSILVLWMFITWGIYFINISHFVPKSPITLPSLFFASVFVIEPFIGWETITYFAEESKIPKRDIPKAIVYASVFVTILYSAVIFVTLGVSDIMQLKQTYYPIAETAKVFLGGNGAIIIALGAITVLLGCLNSWIVSTARLPYALARDGYFPKIINKIHKKHATPHTSLIFQFIFASLAVSIATYEEIIYILVSIAMIMYVLIFASIIKHRQKNINIPYKLPFGPLIPTFASIIAIFVLVQIKLIYLLIDFGLIFLGSMFYFHMNKRR